MDLNTNNNNNTCNGIRTNFSRANSAANILEVGQESVTRDIHPTVKITNLTSSSLTKQIPNGNLRRSYLSVNLDDANDVVWKRKSELNLNNKDDINDFVNTSNVAQVKHQQEKKNIYNANFNDNEHFITIPTRRKCINSKAQTENNYLVWITPVAASLSIAIIVAALAGPQWLFTEERLSKSYLNDTALYKPRGDDSDFITKFTKSSLWILCTDLGNENPQEYHCKAIDYFPNETYSPDPIDSTNAIQYAITSSTPSLLIANFIHIVSYILLMLAMFSDKHTIYFFVSGVAFIISGLLMLIGLILYISIFKAEVGSKLRPKSTLQPAVFSYRYGYSFILYIVGILLVFCSGILNVFLYTGFHNETTFSRPVKQQNSPCFINYSKLRRISVSQASRRNSVNTNASPCPSDRRFVLRKDPNCNVHSNQLAKSLNQLYTEPAPDVAPFETYPIHTRNVSTTTENSPPEKTDTKESSKLMHNICGLKRSFMSSCEKPPKEKCVNNTTPRPKDIYYIEDDGETDLSNIFVIEPLETFHRRRRASLYGEMPLSTLNVHKLRAFNSNHSLSDLDKVFPTNYHNLDTQYYDKLSNSSKIFNGSFGSRTLPRNFVQKNFGYEDSRRVSASGIFLTNNTFENGKLEPPQPISGYNPYTLSNSHSNILDSHRYEISPPVWPKIIINSPAHHHHQQQQQQQQQPQIPPPMLDNKYSRYRSNNINSINNVNGRKISNSCDNILNDEDDEFIMNGSGNGGLSKTFDLDQIEYERRKSHAALFDHYNTGLNTILAHKIHGRDLNDSGGGNNNDDGTPV